MATSAGILMFRDGQSEREVLLVHPGGPFWAKKDDGAWSIPKGEYTEAEEPLAAARREFEEEMGSAVMGKFLELQPVKQKGGKIVRAWAVCGDFDVATLKSNSFTMEWPPKSGKQREFPEVDRAAWFDLDTARRKILESQIPFLDQLAAITGR